MLFCIESGWSHDAREKGRGGLSVECLVMKLFDCVCMLILTSVLNVNDLLTWLDVMLPWLIPVVQAWCQLDQVFSQFGTIVSNMCLHSSCLKLGNQTWQTPPNTSTAHDQHVKITRNHCQPVVLSSSPEPQAEAVEVSIVYPEAHEGVDEASDEEEILENTIQ